MTAGPRTPFLTKTGFPPLIDETARILVLGALPGEESLRRREYYGHPRNQFWRILADIYHVPVAENYPGRVALLRQQQLALWDVVHHGERQGSLDQAIRNAVPNDFRELFETYRNLRAIVFNGRKAHDLFEHLVLKQPALAGGDQLPRLLMPSTSPAATMLLAEKTRRWRQISDL